MTDKPQCRQCGKSLDDKALEAGLSTCSKCFLEWMYAEKFKDEYLRAMHEEKINRWSYE